MEIPRLFLVLLMIEVSFITFSTGPVVGQNGNAVKVDVGVVLDCDTISGKMRNACISLALSDFYSNRNHTAQIVPHFRDSKSDDVDAASAAIELLKIVEVQAILGPQGSTEADFVTDIGRKVKVPIISSATSPALSPTQNPYFIRTAYCSCWQAKAIAAIVKAFGWRELVFIYENSNFGSGILPHLTDAMMEISVSVPDRSVLSPTANDDEIMAELYKLKTKQTRVFIVHLHPAFASQFFLKVKEAGMMSSGYVWIITDAFTSILVSMDPKILDSLQGVIGVKPYVPSSVELDKFTGRWKSKTFRQQYPDMDGVELNVFGLWAYDSVTALATALEKLGTSGLKFNRTTNKVNSTDLDAIGTSEFGPLLLESIRNINLRGLSGDFHIVDGELQPSAFQIVNVIGREEGIGFWTEKNGISKNPNSDDTTVYSANKDDLGAIMWPGKSSAIPRGWDIPTGEKKIRVGVPVRRGLEQFEQFINVTIDNHTNTVMEATGFCVDVFEKVIKSMPYSIPFEYIPCKISPGGKFSNYNDLVDEVFKGKLDALVGDVTILSNRSEYVDFTLPFTESGVTLVVPVKENGRSWIFLKPLEKQLWMMIAVFFVLIGTVIWAFEHPVNPDFKGSTKKQLGMILWISLSCLIFPDKEKVRSKLSRFVMIVWMLMVLVLVASYTASFASLLTVQQLQPTVTDVKDLIKKGKYIGCQNTSFVADKLKNVFGSKKIRYYNTLEEYDEALRNGSENGGVDGIMDELPYFRPFFRKNPGKYTAVGPIYHTAGFGFAFPRGSPLVHDVSKAVLRVTESDDMMRILEKWFGDETLLLQDVSLNDPESLPLDRFKELFIIAAVLILFAFIAFVFSFIDENKGILTPEMSIWQKLSALAKVFFEEKQKVEDSRSPNEGSQGVVSSPELPMAELRRSPKS